LHHNNRYFGDRSKLITVERPKEIILPKVGELILSIRIYIAQHNFVDTEPSAIIPASARDNPAARYPLLPGQPMDLENRTPPAYMDLEVPFNEGDAMTLLDILGLAVVQSEGEGLGFLDSLGLEEIPIPDTGLTLEFLQAFEHGGVKYQEVTTGMYGLQEIIDPTDPPVNEMWAGWGVAYFEGIHRPERFETYPVLALNQYPIYPPVDGSRSLAFTLDYIKTEAIYFDDTTYAGGKAKIVPGTEGGAHAKD
jgi:hypothetical protein